MAHRTAKNAQLAPNGKFTGPQFIAWLTSKDRLTALFIALLSKRNITEKEPPQSKLSIQFICHQLTNEDTTNDISPYKIRSYEARLGKKYMKSVVSAEYRLRIPYKLPEILQAGINSMKELHHKRLSQHMWDGKAIAQGTNCHQGAAIFTEQDDIPTLRLMTELDARAFKVRKGPTRS